MPKRHISAPAIVCIGLKKSTSGNIPDVYYLTQNKIILGRSSQAHIQLRIGRISREHCYFENLNNKWVVKAGHKSLVVNGTVLDGGSTRDLVCGDKIKIPEVVLQFKCNPDSELRCCCDLKITRRSSDGGETSVEILDMDSSVPPLIDLTYAPVSSSATTIQDEELEWLPDTEPVVGRREPRVPEQEIRIDDPELDTRPQEGTSPNSPNEDYVAKALGTIGHLQAEKDEAVRQLDDSEKKIEELSRQLNEYKRKCSQFEMLQLEHEYLKELKKQINRNCGENERLKVQVDALTKENAIIKNECRGMMTKITDGQQELVAKEEIILSMKRKHEQELTAMKDQLGKINRKSTDSSSAKNQSEQVATLKRGIDDIIERDLQCSICNELFVEPMVTNCNHIFCKFCINQWLSANSNCPLCRANIVTVLVVGMLDTFIGSFMTLLSTERSSERQQVVTERRAAEEAAEAAVLQAAQAQRPRGAQRARRGIRGRRTTRARTIQASTPQWVDGIVVELDD